MTRRGIWTIAGALLLVAGAGIGYRIVGNRVPGVPPEVARYRQNLFDMLRPAGLANCRLERFGEANDGGYLMCANLLEGVEAGYSYGISGYDKWGCDISARAGVTVHQYDCFNPTRPACVAGTTVFHDECVGGRTEAIEGRPFDTVQNQFLKNGDAGKRIVLKIDVEGSEWDTFLSMSDEALGQIDQMAVEFHWQESGNGQWTVDPRYPKAISRLKQFFEVAHLHFNNWSCTDGLSPFPSWAYEVLFVSKRLAVVDPNRPAGGLHPEDAPNSPSAPDCQPRR